MAETNGVDDPREIFLQGFRSSLWKAQHGNLQKLGALCRSPDKKDQNPLGSILEAPVVGTPHMDKEKPNWRLKINPHTRSRKGVSRRQIQLPFVWSVGVSEGLTSPAGCQVVALDGPNTPGLRKRQGFSSELGVSAAGPSMKITSKQTRTFSKLRPLLNTISKQQLDST